MDKTKLLDKIEDGSIRALSIKQPYPHYIFHKGKDLENRDWPTKGRGWILIHAGVSKSEIDTEDEAEMSYPRGGIVGAARIVDCVSEMDSNWFFGRYGFVLRDAFPVPLIPCKGKLSFFAVDDDVRSAVAEHVRALIAQEATCAS